MNTQENTNRTSRRELDESQLLEIAAGELTMPSIGVAHYAATQSPTPGIARRNALQDPTQGVARFVALSNPPPSLAGDD